MQAAQRLATAHAIDLAVAARTPSGMSGVPFRQGAGSDRRAGQQGPAHLRRTVHDDRRANDLTFDGGAQLHVRPRVRLRSDIAAAKALDASLAVQMVRGSDAWAKSGDHRQETTWRRVIRRDDWAPTATGALRRWMPLRADQPPARILKTDGALTHRSQAASRTAGDPSRPGRAGRDVPRTGPPAGAPPRRGERAPSRRCP